MSLIDLSDIRRTMLLPDNTELPILRGISLSIDAGEHVAIVGRSGSGKSTLLNLLGLLDSPSSGTYLLDGQNTARHNARRRAQLRGERFGFVFQQFNLLPGLTATENVATPLLYATGRAFVRRRSLAREMLDRVGLGHRLEALPNRLSGGEQQRVAIARALVREPHIVLADEPTGALDPATGIAVMHLMEGLIRDTGATLITITHDSSVADRADRRIHVRDGRLVGEDMAADHGADHGADHAAAQGVGQ